MLDGLGVQEVFFNPFIITIDRTYFIYLAKNTINPFYVQYISLHLYVYFLV